LASIKTAPAGKRALPTVVVMACVVSSPGMIAVPVLEMSTNAPG
jgi:hypothetical protein